MMRAVTLQQLVTACASEAPVEVRHELTFYAPMAINVRATIRNGDVLLYQFAAVVHSDQATNRANRLGAIELATRLRSLAAQPDRCPSCDGTDYQINGYGCSDPECRH